MKKIKWPLLAVALAVVAAAFANRSISPSSLHRYAFMSKTIDGSKYYTSKDLTSAGWVKGVDYDCVYPVTTCTFLANPLNIHVDFTGTWFYYSDLPVSGIDNSGSFVNLNE